LEKGGLAWPAFPTPLLPIMRLSEFLKEEHGVSSVEYALLASLIAVVCAAIVAAVGLNTLNLYTVVCNGVAAATGNPSC